jgi:hypothetical protein
VSSRLLIALALLLAACGSSQAPSPAPPPQPGAKIDGTEGAVCAWGHRDPHPGHSPAACAAGMQCCYPCGIDGCDSVCEAVTECPELF